MSDGISDMYRDDRRYDKWQQERKDEGNNLSGQREKETLSFPGCRHTRISKEQTNTFDGRLRIKIQEEVAL